MPWSACLFQLSVQSDCMQHDPSTLRLGDHCRVYAACIAPDSKTFNRWLTNICFPQVAVAPLRWQPPEWPAFQVEATALLLQPERRAAGGEIPVRLQSALQDAGRKLVAAAGALAASPLQAVILPEPSAAIAAMKGEAGAIFPGSMTLPGSMTTSRCAF